ncbi:MAG: class I SAM-dependent methyltransferase [Promethearchaeota archaeon]
MPHVFNFKHIEILESDERKSLQPVETLMNLIQKVFPRERRKIACEIGPGAGHFTIPLANLFDKVYAIEINKEMISYLKKKVDKIGITNIHFILSSSPPLIEEKINLALFADVLHELENPEEYLEWTSAISEGVIVIDWKKENMSFGPPVEVRISENEARLMLMKAGFLAESCEVYPHHYILVGEKP